MLTIRLWCICCAFALAQTTSPTTRPGRGWGFPDKENIKAKDGFGAQLWFLDQTFIADWRKPEEPRVSPVKTAQRGQRYVAVIIFAGAAANQDQKADVTYDIAIRAPDGSIYGEAKNLTAWSREAQDGNVLRLSEQYLTVEIEPTDPAGQYTIEASVRDNLRKIELPLKTQFNVAPN